MLNIKQFRYNTDNLGYLLFGHKNAIAVDGGATEDISAFLDAHHLALSIVTNTHSHPDHTVGNETLIRRFDAIGVTSLAGVEKDGFTLDDESIHVFHTPGHSADSVVFQIGSFLLTGDTLFNGTIGNCFSGDMPGYFNSLKFLMTFPKETVIYAGHDYVTASLAFAAQMEPGNKDIESCLAAYRPGHVRSTLSDEFNVNPYLRFNAPAIVRQLQDRGLRVETEYERWESLMSIE